MYNNSIYINKTVYLGEIKFLTYSRQKRKEILKMIDPLPELGLERRRGGEEEQSSAFKEEEED
jgi:hypothetical protein